MTHISKAIDQGLNDLLAGLPMAVGDLEPPVLTAPAGDGAVYLTTSDDPGRFALRLVCALAGLDFIEVLGGLDEDELALMYAAAASVYERSIFIIKNTDALQ